MKIINTKGQKTGKRKQCQGNNVHFSMYALTCVSVTVTRIILFIYIYFYYYFYFNRLLKLASGTFKFSSFGARRNLLFAAIL